MMNKLIMLLLFSITTNAYALPECPKDLSKPWDKCFGTSTFANGNKYVGEFKDNKYHGQGIYTYGDESQWAGDKYVGEYKDDKRHGQGTYTFADGEQWAGFYSNNQFIPNICEDMGLIKGSSEFGQCVITLINKL